jgi:hypothetical protein
LHYRYVRDNKLPGIGMTVANVARMRDYYVGESENSEADRKAAQLILRAARNVPLAVLATGNSSGTQFAFGVNEQAAQVRRTP